MIHPDELMSPPDRYHRAIPYFRGHSDFGSPNFQKRNQGATLFHVISIWASLLFACILFEIIEK